MQEIYISFKQQVDQLLQQGVDPTIIDGAFSKILVDLKNKQIEELVYALYQEKQKQQSQPEVAESEEKEQE